MGKMLFVYTTVPSESDAQNLSKFLLEKGLAGCVNIWQISSKYWWKGKLESGKEFAVLVKTLPNLEQEVKSTIKDKHPYTTPIIATWIAEVNAEYHAWLTDVLKTVR